jgi:hypothetical protein
MMELERVLRPLGASVGITPGSDWHGIPARKYIDLREDSKTTSDTKSGSDPTSSCFLQTYLSTRANVQHHSMDSFT